MFFVRCVAFFRDGDYALTSSGMDWSHEDRRLVAGSDNTVRIWARKLGMKSGS